MILVDSNIVIYSRQQGYDKLREQLSLQDVAACSVVQIEVLGWHLLEVSDKSAFQAFFNQATVYQLDDAIVNQTIKVRQSKPGVHLADAIIAATAIVHSLVLWTANADDFSDIKDLKIINPLKKKS